MTEEEMKRYKREIADKHCRGLIAPHPDCGASPSGLMLAFQLATIAAIAALGGSLNWWLFLRQ